MSAAAIGLAFIGLALAAPAFAQSAQADDIEESYATAQEAADAATKRTTEQAAERAAEKRAAEAAKEAAEAESLGLPQDPYYRSEHRPPPSFALIERPIGAAPESGPALLLIMADYILRPEGKLIRASIARPHNPDLRSNLAQEWRDMDKLVRNKVGLLKWQPVMTQITPTETSLYLKAFPGKNYGIGKIGNITLAQVSPADVARLTSLTKDDFAQGVIEAAESVREQRNAELPHLKNYTMPVRFLLGLTTRYKDAAGQKAFMARMLESFPGTGPYHVTDASEAGYPMLALHMDYDPVEARLYINAICAQAEKQRSACFAVWLREGKTQPQPIQ